MGVLHPFHIFVRKVDGGTLPRPFYETVDPGVLAPGARPTGGRPVFRHQPPYAGAYGAIWAVPLNWSFVLAVATVSNASFTLGFLNPPSLRVSFLARPGVVIYDVVLQISSPNGILDGISQLVTIICVVTVVMIKMAVFARFDSLRVCSHSRWCWEYTRVARTTYFHQDFGLGSL